MVETLLVVGSGESTPPTSLLPGTDFPLFASIHAESFQKGAAVATSSADVFSVGSHSAVTCPKGEHEEYIEMRPSCRLAQDFHTSTDSEWYKTNLS